MGFSAMRQSVFDPKTLIFQTGRWCIAWLAESSVCVLSVVDR
jgi:hypothetical protein